MITTIIKRVEKFKKEIFTRENFGVFVAHIQILIAKFEHTFLMSVV